MYGNDIIVFLGKELAVMKKIIVFIFILFLSSIPLLGNINSSLLIIFREFFLTICYLSLAALLWRNKYSRLLSLLLLFLWVFNTSISIIIYHLFSSSLNYQLAMTMLSTNVQESADFLLAYWHVFAITLFLLISVIYAVHKYAQLFSKYNLLILSFILLLTSGYKFAESAFKGRLSDPLFNMAEKVMPYTSLNNLGVFSRAYQELSILKSIFSYQPNYDLVIEDTHIDTYVIVIGESVRRDHVSLYGYSRATMPNIEKQRNNLLIFEQAIAPAPITTMALSSILTAKTPEDNTLQLINDNIVQLANAAGFETYWFSRQNEIGQFETIVSGIGKSALNKDWLTSGYDDVLLKKLEWALTDEQSAKPKKLIVLHTNGSHLSACNQYPKSEAYFTDGRFEYEDCYDNSIRFTDKLLGEIITKLKNRSASVLYFSDHGQQKRIKRGELDYIHGSINPSKESVDVPQFIWFSPILDKENKKIGSYVEPYATADDYYLIANWLGIKKINNKYIYSPLLDDYQSKEKVIIMDTKLNIFAYDQLPSDNVIN